MHISIYSNLLPIVITVCSAASISNEEIAKILGDRETLDPMRSISSFQGMEDIDAFKNRLDAMTGLPADMDDDLYETLGTEDDSGDRVAGGLYDTKTLEEMFPVVSNGRLSLPPPSYPQLDRLPFFIDKDTTYFTDKGNSQDDEPISVERRNPFCNRRRGCRGKRSRVQELVRDILRKRFICNPRRGCSSRRSRGEIIKDNNGQAQERAGMITNSPCDVQCQQNKQKLIDKYLFGGKTVKKFLAELKSKAMFPSTQRQYPNTKNTLDNGNDEFESARNVFGTCGVNPCDPVPTSQPFT